MRYLSLCIIFLFTSPAFAQLGKNAAENEMNLRQLMELNGFSPGARGFDHRYQGVKGTPFLKQDYLKGTLVINEPGAEPIDAQMNLDLSQHKIELLLPNGLSGNLAASRVSSIQLFDQADTLHFISLPAGTVNEPGDDYKLYQVLFRSSRYTLLKRTDVYLEKANYQGAYSPDRRYDEFKPQTKYFLGQPEAYQVIRLRAKKVLSALKREDAGKAEKWLKENSQSVESEDGLIAVLSHLE
ncbi:MAG: hypothetical protein H6562_08630 [Lewinellaceae bacterium]|nr:hypothetical protein [Lewinella sp.]MCB9278963.1 hypothetical protein [Lewinellaceae bacterium]